jgi:hypothetical protein
MWVGPKKKRVGDKVFMVGGFDRFHHSQGCRPEEMRGVVQACFEQAGKGGDGAVPGDVRGVELSCRL